MSNFSLDLVKPAATKFVEWVKWVWTHGHTEPRIAYISGIGTGLIIALVLKIIF